MGATGALAEGAGSAVAGGAALGASGTAGGASVATGAGGGGAGSVLATGGGAGGLLPDENAYTRPPVAASTSAITITRPPPPELLAAGAAAAGTETRRLAGAAETALTLRVAGIVVAPTAGGLLAAGLTETGLAADAGALLDTGGVDAAFADAGAVDVVGLGDAG